MKALVGTVCHPVLVTNGDSLGHVLATLVCDRRVITTVLVPSSRCDDVDGRLSNCNATLQYRQDDRERPGSRRNKSSIGDRRDEGGEKAIAPRLLNEIVGCNEIDVAL